GSDPTVETRATREPNLARFSATFRPTPPGVRTTVPALLVPATRALAVRALTSTFAPPITRTSGGASTALRPGPGAAALRGRTGSRGNRSGPPAPSESARTP